MILWVHKKKNFTVPNDVLFLPFYKNNTLPTYNTHPCIEADAVELMLRAFDGYYPKWRYTEKERQRGDELLKNHSENPNNQIATL